MTQRVFDAKNEQDVKDLFDLLPDDCVRVVKYGMQCDCQAYFDGKGSSQSRHINMIKINWNDLTEIHRPVDYSVFVNKLGWFWDDDVDRAIIGILVDISILDEKPFTQGAFGYGYSNWRNFRPLTLEEIKEKNLVGE